MARITNCFPQLNDVGVALESRLDFGFTGFTPSSSSFFVPRQDGSATASVPALEKHSGDFDISTTLTAAGVGVSQCGNGAGNEVPFTVTRSSPTASDRTLTVTETGSGTGTVISAPGGIDCGTTCSATFPDSTDVALTADPNAGSAFAGWIGGGCTGTGPCVTTLAADTTVTATFDTAPPTPYVLVAGDGGVFEPSDPGSLGTGRLRPGDGILRDAQGRIVGASGTPIDSPVVAIAYTPDRQGYWLAQANGGVIPVGDAPEVGNLRSLTLRSPIVGAAATRDRTGLYLVAADGGVFALGSAPFKGSLGGAHLNKPIVATSLDADGSGYLLVASDGGVFTFDATFRGSLGATRLDEPIVGMAVAPDGGYILAASDGGAFTFGPAFAGSLGGVHLDAPVVGIALDPDGTGYWMAGADGGVFSFDAQFFGSVADILLQSPIIGIVAL